MRMARCEQRGSQAVLIDGSSQLLRAADVPEGQHERIGQIRVQRRLRCTIAGPPLDGSLVRQDRLGEQAEVTRAFEPAGQRCAQIGLPPRVIGTVWCGPGCARPQQVDRLADNFSVLGEFEPASQRFAEVRLPARPIRSADQRIAVRTDRRSQGICVARELVTIAQRAAEMRQIARPFASSRAHGATQQGNGRVQRAKIAGRHPLRGQAHSGIVPGSRIRFHIRHREPALVSNDGVSRTPFSLLFRRWEKASRRGSLRLAAPADGGCSASLPSSTYKPYL